MLERRPPALTQRTPTAHEPAGGDQEHVMRRGRHHMLETRTRLSVRVEPLELGGGQLPRRGGNELDGARTAVLEARPPVAAPDEAGRAQPRADRRRRGRAYEQV